MKTNKFENFLENISKGRFLLENDGKNVLKKNWGCDSVNEIFNTVGKYFKMQTLIALKYVVHLIKNFKMLKKMFFTY